MVLLLKIAGRDWLTEKEGWGGGGRENGYVCLCVIVT